MNIVRVVKRIALQILSKVRRFAPLTRILFNVKTPNDGKGKWDFTTLVLKKCLLRYVVPSHRVLEIGTGSYAILSIFLYKKRRCSLLACDINNVYVLKARDVVSMNHADVTVIQSDLFSNAEGKYDIIYFNSVYVPRNVGEELGIDTINDYESDWCGGDDGTEVITRFLADAGRLLAKGGRILLGYNAKYLNEDIVRRLCIGNGYRVLGVCKQFLNPSRVFVIESVGR